jgi:hypothetical protein
MIVGDYAIHDADNISDHEPVVFQLLLEVKILEFCEKLHKPHASWDKANDLDLCKYRSVLGQKLRLLKLPVDALLCSDLTCTNMKHFYSITEFVRAVW